MNSQVRIFRLDAYNYPKFRGKIIELYLQAFTTGEYAQFIEPETAESTLDEILRNGFGEMAFFGNRLAGVLIAFPLSYDNDFPKEECPNITVKTSVYIAEVMTHPDFQGKGVATEMLDTFLKNEKDNYTNVVIRVWDENKPALALYEKLGFHLVSAITQTKYRSQYDEFEMRKIYMRKEI